MINLSIFRRKDFPYLFTLLVGLVAYQSNRISENLINTPTLEYRFEYDPATVEVNEKNKSVIIKRVECYLTNITKNFVFDSVALSIQYPNCCQPGFESLEGSVYNVDIIAVPPARTLDKSQHVTESFETVAEIVIPEFQPGMQYLIRFTASYTPHDGVDYIMPEIYFSEDRQQDDVLLIEKRSPKTWFVYNQFWIQFSLLIFYICCAVIYFFFLSVPEKSKDAEETKEPKRATINRRMTARFRKRNF